ncbi:BTAD domain-containing putative transcriptional regulator [Winogradskya consettensis]|uniref:SARP family transcriptional regulator n=1 Tax=Winogradskya consettensis TaxID=113560 RepID=A0A919SAW4_9ACTN|nr:BTAD domain-containing putative transcriptional regulator [Actinoplanes consettensis]GIM68222.1 SARP family transcriptional regulator [Actinoplanes consettensis]
MVTKVSFGVLGPVEAWTGGHALRLGPPQQRTVLAAILLNEGAVTSTDELIEALWAEKSPAAAVKTVRTYVSRLRTVLTPAGVTIESVARGYLLRTGPESFDLARFRNLTAPLPAPASPADRADRARQALKTFRGEPLAGLNGVWAETHRAQLSYLRAAAYETLFTAELDAGNHAAAIAGLPAAIRQFPLRERLHELHVLALHQTGLRAEALAAYRAVERLLAQELGIEPMPALQELHRRMLQNDPSLAPDPEDLPRPDGEAPPEPGWPARPAQLPPAPAVFNGRDSELRRADELLAAFGTGPAIVVIAGMGGVGKTSTALHWAHRLASRHTEGQLYADLRGYVPHGEPLSPADVLDGFLQALGVTAAKIPGQLAARAALFRSLLADLRMLILLDNAATADQVLDLLPGTGNSLVIVTSRGTVPDLVVRTGAAMLVLRPPEHEEALALFAARAGADRVRAEPAAARDILDLSGRLPLALAVVAARAAASTHLPLSAIADDLRATSGTLSAFRQPDAAFDVAAVLSWSYRSLGDDAAEAFRRLCLHPGPHLSADAAASMLARPVPGTRGLLAELVAAALLTEDRPGRWTTHDLVRAYGNEVAIALDPPQQRQATLHRMLDHYLYAARNANSRLFRRQEPIVPEQPAPGVIDPDADPVAWFDAEHPALLAALQAAALHGFDRHAWQLSWVIRDYLNRQGLWHHLQTSQEAGHAAAVRGGEPVAQARSMWGLAIAESKLGRYPQAHIWLRCALSIFETAGDREAVVRTHVLTAFALSEQGDWAAALDHYRLTLALSGPGADPAERAGALNATSWANAKLGRYADAVADARAALAMAPHLNPTRLAAIWDTLGHAHFGGGETAEGEHSYRRAVELYRRNGAPVLAAESLQSFATMLERAGRGGEAPGVYREALSLVAEAAGPHAAQLRAELSRALATDGQRPTAWPAGRYPRSGSPAAR